jgi:hypothetical protein
MGRALVVLYKQPDFSAIAPLKCAALPRDRAVSRLDVTDPAIDSLILGFQADASSFRPPLPT